MLDPDVSVIRTQRHACLRIRINSVSESRGKRINSNRFLTLKESFERSPKPKFAPREGQQTGKSAKNVDRLQHFQPKEPLSESETHFGVNKQNEMSHGVLVRCIRTLERETETNSTRGNNTMAKAAAKKAPAKKSAAKKAPAKKKAAKKR